MMQPPLQERFDMLLGFIKNPDFKITAEANIAAARELLDTLLVSGLLLADEYRAYQAQVSSAKLVHTAGGLHRETDKAGF